MAKHGPSHLATLVDNGIVLHILCSALLENIQYSLTNVNTILYITFFNKFQLTRLHYLNYLNLHIINTHLISLAVASIISVAPTPPHYTTFRTDFQTTSTQSTLESTIWSCSGEQLSVEVI